MATERNPIDEDVERAFDLLQHYKGLLSSLNPGAADLQNALNGIEDVMRTWLPRAAPANDPLLEAVSAKLGDREGAKDLLAHSDLWEARLQCLQRLADASIPATLSTRDVLDECRARLKHWRKLLPTIFRMGNGQRHLQTGAREAAQLVGRYWSTGIEERPSIRGASLFLAASCDALARAAHHAGRGFDAAVRFAQRLREHPNWVQVEPLDVVAVLDEQLAAVRGVEELIAELDIVAGAEDRVRSAPQAAGQVAGSTRQRMTFQTVLVRSPNRLSRVQLTAIEKAFEKLANDFESASGPLRTSSGSTVAFADVRTLMATAGRLLLRLLLHRAIDGPGSMPSWLGLAYSRPRPRPHFRELRDSPMLVLSRSLHLIRGLISNILAMRNTWDKKTPRSGSESRRSVFLHRHLWLEACSGWLGYRCEPRLHITAPTLVAVSEVGDQEEEVRLVIDWDNEQTNPTLLFLDIARGSAAACRHLAGLLRAIKGLETEGASVAHGLHEGDSMLPAWDARHSFHRATMAVYADLGTLIEILKREPNLRIALLVFDEQVCPRAAPERGDPEFVADLKHAAGRLRLSLATARRIRDTHGASSYVDGGGCLFGAISRKSYHDALLDAAEAVFEPDAEGASRSWRRAPPQSESGVVRREVLKEAMDPVAWARLRTNLEHEFDRASLLPPNSPDGSKPPLDGKLGDRVGTETLRHLRRVLDVGVQVRSPQATRGLEELRGELEAEDRAAFDRSIAAKNAAEAADTEVRANREGWLRIDGPVFTALRNAGLASLNGTEVVFSGEEAEREKIISAERAKLQAALEAKCAARTAAPRPEQAMRKAHEAMLSLLRERLGHLRDVLDEHGPLIARPLDQEAPRYGPTAGSHPPHFWTGPSGHDVLAQLAAAVLEAEDAGEDPGIVMCDEEWERLRCDIQRECGVLARREPLARPTASIASVEPSVHDPRPLRFARKPDAKQLCLEALANAPEGIPRHQDIADATGLELQTVKEAMPKLKDAGHVAKLDGAWRITPRGREHLKLLRGE